MVDLETGRIWFLYQARRVNTQTNVAGGALTTGLTLATGQVARPLQIYIQGAASAGAGLVGYVVDEDSAQNAIIVNVAAGASRVAHLPTVGTAANANSNLTELTMLGPGQRIYFTTSAALQNETLTVGVVLLLSTAVAPTWDTTGSAGTPSLAASTISASNSLQAVIL